MVRLIDADVLIPMMKYATTDSEIGVFPIKIGFNDIEKVINEQPTVNTATMIESLPSAQPEPQWIPVSERMPRDGTWNIFTDGKNISVERYKADAFDHFFPNGRWFQLEDVIAWMPLPEPYKGGEKKMNDLISRQAAIDEIARWKGYLDEDMIERIQIGLKKLLSAQPEIIRCKDCRYYQDNNDGYPHINCKWDANETPDEDDFCSGAERRTDD